MARLKYESGTLGRNVAMLPEKIRENITLLIDYAARHGENKLKVEAPWTNITTNARNGLFTATEHTDLVGNSAGTHKIVFSHGVDYGIWLEVANEGKFQIIMPTALSVGKDIMKALDNILSHPNDPMPDVFSAPVPRHVPRKQSSRSHNTTRRTKTTTRRSGKNR